MLQAKLIAGCCGPGMLYAGQIRKWGKCELVVAQPEACPELSRRERNRIRNVPIIVVGGVKWPARDWRQALEAK